MCAVTERASAGEKHTPLPAPGRAAWVAPVLLAGWAVFLMFRYHTYLTAAPVPSVDLPAHAALVQRLHEQLGHGRLFFFDTAWFSGWAAFDTYPWLAHLFAAVIGGALATFTNDPWRLAVHLAILGSIAVLPLSLDRAIRACLCRAAGTESSRERSLRALTAGVLAFWFLDHPRGSAWGIGAAAALQMGLFPQALAWNLLLLYFAEVAAAVAGRGRARTSRLAWAFAGLLLTHTLTAAFAAALALVAAALAPGSRRTLAAGHGLPLLCTAFWWLPLASHLGTSTLVHIEPAQGDVLRLLFVYPVADLARALFSGVVTVEFTPVLLLLAAVVWVVDPRLRRQRPAGTLMAALIVVTLAVGSGFVAASFPVGLHYYRFFAYAVLLSLPLLGAVPVYLGRRARAASRPVARAACALLAAALLAGALSDAMLPQPVLARIGRIDPAVRYREENAVLDRLASGANRGRVLFEYFSDPDRFPVPSPHYMTARLWRRTGRETWNGLLIQGSLAYAVLARSAEAAGLHMYRVPRFPEARDLSAGGAVAVLRDLGVTDIVAATPRAVSSLRRHASGPVQREGRFSIIPIAPGAPPLVRPVELPVVAYSDAAGTLPFKIVELYFYSRDATADGLALLEVSSGQPLPPGTAVILSSGTREQTLAVLKDAAMKSQPEIVALDFPGAPLLDHYRFEYTISPDGRLYAAAKQRLDERALPVLLRTARAGGAATAGNLADDVRPSVRWSAEEQDFVVDGLQPGRLFRLNYTYTPYWRSDEAAIYRGGAERTYLVPTTSRARLSFRRYADTAATTGTLASLFGIAALLILRYRRRRAAR